MRSLLVGHVCLDRFGPDRLPGGSAYYGGRAARALGADVRVFTAAGADFPADALGGLEAHVVPALRTTSFTNLRGRDGVRRQRVEAVAPALDVSTLPAAWADTDVLHLAPLVGEVDLAAWRAAVRARFLGIQVQGWVRRVDDDGTVLPAPFPPGALADVDAAVLGDDEARDDPELVRRLAAEIPVVVLTHADEGCVVLERGRATRVGVFRTVEVDPTGAGDVFAAAFFLALARGDPAVEAAQLGAAAASIVVEGRAGAALDRVSTAPSRVLGISTAG
jgi:sugar/nucleoside kinase (ribokinase family)